MQTTKTKQKNTKETRHNAITQIMDKIARSEEILEAIGDAISIQDRTYKIIYENLLVFRIGLTRLSMKIKFI
jgi:hypothetical protein